MRRLVAVVALVLLAVGCSAQQVATFQTLTPAQQASVAAGLYRPDETGLYVPPGDCHAAVDALWPAASRAWAHRIVQRESRGIATAQNPTSSAAGCFQLLRLHAWRIPGGWANRYNATANIRGALSLYREAGTRPWAL